MNLTQIFNLRINSKDACQAFLGSWRRKKPIVRLPQATHVSVTIPTGQGKGVSFITPFLRMCRETCVVLDIKNGENARLTADYRRRFGPVWMLDPYKVVTNKPDCLNPLDVIAKESRLAIDDCNQLANAAVVRTGMENEPHWNDRAEGVIAALMALVVVHGDRERGSRSLQSVREMVSNPELFKLAMKALAESDDWEGLLRQMGGDLFNLEEKEKASVLSTVGRHLRFLGTPAIADSIKRSSFRVSDLRKKGQCSTLFLVLPAERAEVSQGYLRSIISTVISSCIREGLDETRRVHLVLDEAASLGPMPAINNVLQVGRGFGLHLQTYWQSQGQLKKCFPKEGEDLLLLSNSTQVYAAANEPVTCDFISKRLGTMTQVVKSGGHSSGKSHTFSKGPHRSVSDGWTSNSNSNWAQQQRALMTPDEVGNLDPRTAITFAPGMRPIITRTIRYYEEPKLFSEPHWLGRQWRAFKTLVIAIVLCAMALGAAAVVTRVFDYQIRRSMPVSPYQMQGD